MEVTEQVKRANEINQELEILEQQSSETLEKISKLTEERAIIYASLLDYCKTNGVVEEECANAFLNYFHKEDVAWLDDEGLLAKLKEDGLKDYIKVTTKESIDKTKLKKDFKINTSLKESYKAFYGTKLTEYVTVTTTENHAKMLAHIEENQK